MTDAHQHQHWRLIFPLVHNSNPLSNSQNRNSESRTDHPYVAEGAAKTPEESHGLPSFFGGVIQPGEEDTREINEVHLVAPGLKDISVHYHDRKVHFSVLTKRSDNGR